MLEEVFTHKRVIRFRMVLGQSYVFVHVECTNKLKANRAILVHFDQLSVHAKRRAAGWQT